MSPPLPLQKCRFPEIYFVLTSLQEEEKPKPQSFSQREVYAPPRTSTRSTPSKLGYFPLERTVRDLFLYPFDGDNSVVVTTSDAYRLNNGQWLNDSVMDFYFRYLHNQLDEKLKSRVHIFNTFFYRRLNHKTAGM